MPPRSSSSVAAAAAASATGGSGGARRQPAAHYDEMTAAEALSTLELQRVSLNDLDGVIDIAETDPLVMSVLRRDVNLKETLEEHQRQLADLEEAFIEGHCGQIEDLCRLYHEVSECEDKLLAFEQQIAGFQQRLTDTAEDIVSMQRETLRVKQKLDNRRDVSHRIKEVYDALNECEMFCEKINSARDVDSEYLDNIRHLARKISFLTNNPELEGSAVDNEIRPQLQVASQRAGDKLFRFLVKKFQGFLEEGTNVALQQQAVEKQGQYAFSFLYRFNAPVATELMAHYVKVMAEVYTRQLRGPMRDLCEATGFFSRPFDGLVTPEMLMWLQSGTDGGASGGGGGGGAGGGAAGGGMMSAASRAAATSSGASMARRSQSMSIEQRFDQLKSRVAAKMDGRDALREATFEDHVNAVRAVDVSYRLINLNPVYMIDIERTTCWVARLDQVFMRLVNNAINEGRFISHFFFVMGPSPDDEEVLLRRIFDRLHSDIQSRLVAEVQAITCPMTILAAMRALELFKNYISSSADAMPLLLLGELFDVGMGSMRKRLEALLKLHQQTLVQATARPLKPLPALDGSGPLLALLSKNQGLLSALGPHEVARRFALIGGQLELLNSIKIVGSRVSAAEGRRVFDDGTDAQLSGSLAVVRQLLEALAKRHQNLLAMSVFLINNYAHILLRFAAVEAENASTPSSPSRSSDMNSFAGSSFSNVGAAHGGSRLPCAAEVDQLLRAEIANFIREVRSTSMLARVFDFVAAAEAQLGEAFFLNEGAAPAGSGGASATVSENDMLAATTAFSRGWQEQLSTMNANLQLYFAIVPTAPGGDDATSTPLRRSVTPASGRAASMAATPAAASPAAIAPIDAGMATQHTNEVRALVMREYVQTLVTANNKLHRIANHFFPKHSAIQAKAVGHLALTHGAAKYLRVTPESNEDEASP